MSVVKASRDPAVLPCHNEVRLDCDMDCYIHYGQGVAESIGVRGVPCRVTVAKLKNLQPPSRIQSVLNKVPGDDGFDAT